jgi:hypothetical protein
MFGRGVFLKGKNFSFNRDYRSTSRFQLFLSSHKVTSFPMSQLSDLHRGQTGSPVDVSGISPKCICEISFFLIGLAFAVMIPFAARDMTRSARAAYRRRICFQISGDGVLPCQ